MNKDIYAGLAESMTLRLDELERRIEEISAIVGPEQVVITIDPSKISESDAEIKLDEIRQRQATHPMRLIELEDLNTDHTRRLVDAARRLGDAWRTSVHAHGDADTDRLCDEIAEMTKP